MFLERILEIKIRLFFQQGVGDLLFTENQFYGIGTGVVQGYVHFEYCPSSYY